MLRVQIQVDECQASALPSVLFRDWQRVGAAAEASPGNWRLWAVQVSRGLLLNPWGIMGHGCKWVQCYLLIKSSGSGS